jgi:hypothetical protein
MGAGQSAAAHVALDHASVAHDGGFVVGAVYFSTHKPVQYHAVTLTVRRERGNGEEDRVARSAARVAPRAMRLRGRQAAACRCAGPGPGRAWRRPQGVTTREALLPPESVVRCRCRHHLPT